MRRGRIHPRPPALSRPCLRPHGESHGRDGPGGRSGERVDWRQAIRYRRPLCIDRLGGSDHLRTRIHGKTPLLGSVLLLATQHLHGPQLEWKKAAHRNGPCNTLTTLHGEHNRAALPHPPRLAPPRRSRCTCCTEGAGHRARRVATPAGLRLSTMCPVLNGITPENDLT